LLPEGRYQRGSSGPHPPQCGPSVAAELIQVFGAEIGELMLFPIAPEVLDRVELRGIGWQIVDLDFPLLGDQEVLDDPATVLLEAIPDDQQFALHVAAQVPQEPDDLRAADRSAMQLDVEVPPRHTGDCRQGLPTEVVLEDWRLSPRRPSPAAVRAFAQSAFVEEDDGTSFSGSVFFNSGQRTFFQCAIAASSRSKARPTGRWQLQPSCRRTFQTCPGWKRTPHSLSISSATRGAVHRLVLYPKTSGPRSRARSMRRKSAELNRGFRPARPAFFKPRRPPVSSCWAQRLTDCRWTPTSRATSAWLHPCFSSLAAHKRRSSSASKSRLTPAGFPMQRSLHPITKNVTIFCGTQ
jgi:hypothetical protein